MARENVLALLEGGDRRSIGRSDEVVAMVSDDVGLFGQVTAGLWSADLLVRMRAADAAEKITRKRVDLLQPIRRSFWACWQRRRNRNCGGIWRHWSRGWI